MCGQPLTATCISNNEFHLRSIILSVEQRILALVNNWWRKASDNNDDIINFMYHHQKNRDSKAPLNIIKGNSFL